MDEFRAETHARPTRWSDAYDDVRAAVDNLDVRLRAPLLLKEIEGLSVKEVAAMMGLSQSNVKIRLYRARKKLAVALESRRPPTLRDDVTEGTES